MADLHGTAGCGAICEANGPAEGNGVLSCLLHGEGPAAGVASHVRTRFPAALVSGMHVGSHEGFLVLCAPINVVAPVSQHQIRACVRSPAYGSAWCVLYTAQCALLQGLRKRRRRMQVPATIYQALEVQLCQHTDGNDNTSAG